MSKILVIELGDTINGRIARNVLTLEPSDKQFNSDSEFIKYCEDTDLVANNIETLTYISLAVIVKLNQLIKVDFDMTVHVSSVEDIVKLVDCDSIVIRPSYCKSKYLRAQVNGIELKLSKECGTAILTSGYSEGEVLYQSAEGYILNLCKDICKTNKSYAELLSGLSETDRFKEDMVRLNKSIINTLALFLCRSFVTSSEIEDLTCENCGGTLIHNSATGVTSCDFCDYSIAVGV